MIAPRSPLALRAGRVLRAVRGQAITATLGALVALLILTAGAAASTGPVIDVLTSADSTAAPGSTIDYFVNVIDVGDTATDGSQLSLKIALPPGLKLVAATNIEGSSWDCSTLVPEASSAECTYNETLNPHDYLALGPLKVSASVDPSASGTLTSSFTVSGGGAATASAVDPTQITSIAPSFGIDSFDAQLASDRAGDPATQAAGHPYSFTTSILFNTLTDPDPLRGEVYPAQQAKDVNVDLPPGLVADPTATSGVRCTQVQLAVGGIPSTTLCPPGSQVGTATVFTTRGNMFGPPIPVYNLVPPPGVPARFGYNVAGSVVTIDGGVRSDGGYTLKASVRNVTDGLAIAGTTLTLWGVPADASHDAERSCPGQPPVWNFGTSCTTEAQPRALLRSPTSCNAPGEGLQTTLSIDSWPAPGRVNPDGSPDLTDPNWHTATSTSHQLPGFPAAPSERGAPVGISGCDQVPFSPSLSVSADEPAAGSPSGYKFNITVPQSSDPNTIDEADLKRVAVTLPEGVQVSPSSANGLGACSESHVGFVGGGFSEPSPLHFNGEEASCPDSSKLGEVEVSTPLLEEPLKGYAYLATPHENPFGSLLAMYLVVKGPGVLVKLPGELSTDPNTGRITATFDHNPQLPVNSIKLSLSDGSRAALMNPPTCGSYSTQGQFSSWAEPASTLASNSAVSISTNANGEACAAPGFTPAFTAGSTITQAGAFSPLVLSFSRGDSEQQLKGLTETLPPGASAILAGVPLCSEAEAASGNCPESSKIGDVTVASGPGPHPFYLKGQVYLTGPYGGGPYGEVVVVPADAGPFHLGNVVVRGSILINPVTAQATIVSDAFPQFVNGTGIPADVRSVSVNLDRPGFTFNPTNCEALSLIGSLSSQQGAVLPVSAPFHASGCAALPFHPSFAASTQGITSKANGASLTVKVGSKSGPARKAGEEEANIAKVNVQLPSVLPSRLTTLQGACTEKVFAANPASCPERSVVGTATASTPVLSAPLSGPAYLVSHGGAAFPDLVLILQGNGITVELTGHTQIKKGITYSNFETVPDAPISSFELKLPQGPHSVLTANKNLCALAKTVTVKRRVTRKVHGHSRKVSVKVKKLVAEALSMPTSITAQNGAVLKQTTRIAISGCVAKPAAKKKVAKKKKAKRRTGKGAKH